MKIIIRNTDNVVLFAGEILSLDASGVKGNGWAAPAFTIADYSLVDNVTLPLNFSGGDYTYNAGTWARTAQGDAALASSISHSKIAKNAQINQWRADANQSTFTHLTKTIACDALSRSDIDAVAGSISMNGTFPAGFPGAWKATDNTYIPLSTVVAFKAMYDSMTAQGTTNFAHSQSLKTALVAASTQAQIDAITW